jgi:hypothetical protein
VRNRRQKRKEPIEDAQKESRESRFFVTVETALRHLEKPLKTPISSIPYGSRLYAGRAPSFMALIDLDQRPFRAA